MLWSPFCPRDSQEVSQALQLESIILYIFVFFFSLNVHCSIFLMYKASLVAQIVICLQCGRSQVWSLGLGDPLEKGTATHTSILFWTIPWTQQPVGLHSPWDRKELDMTEQLALFTFSLHCSLFLKHMLGISDYVINLSIEKTYSFPSLELPSYPGDSVVKNLPEMQEATCNAGDLGSIPELGQSPVEGNGNPV